VPFYLLSFYSNQCACSLPQLIQKAAKAILSSHIKRLPAD
jgi:hypothetical protein